jgi:hypothetical protein
VSTLVLTAYPLEPPVLAEATCVLLISAKTMPLPAGSGRPGKRYCERDDFVDAAARAWLRSGPVVRGTPGM